MTLHFAKAISRSISAVSAAALVHIGSAAAASPAGDIQQQVRQLLAGNQPHSLRHSEQSKADVARAEVDSQKFVRELLQGQTLHDGPTKRSEGSGASHDPTSLHSRSAHRDIQASVRGMLLGQRDVARHSS